MIERLEIILERYNQLCEELLKPEVYEDYKKKIDENNLDQCLDLLKYAIHTYNTNILLKESKIFVGIDNVLLNTSLLLQLDIFKLLKLVHPLNIYGILFTLAVSQ